MPQASLSSYFTTRKRGVEDDVIASKNKVICLERTSQSSEPQEGSEELRTVFPDAAPSDVPKTSSVDSETKRVARQTITAQRTTRSKRVYMQNVEGIEAPKLVNFFKGGNLSPQKKSKASVVPVEDSPVVCIEQKNNEATSLDKGMHTPKKAVATDTIESTSLIRNNVMNLDDMKKKLKGSAKLAELKTKLNSIQGGFDKLDRMEKIRLAADAQRQKRAAAAEPAKALKPFKSIELEIMR